MYNVYVIKPDDTIESIARRYNVDPQVIIDLNGLINGVIPEAGTSIVVPTSQNQFFEYYTIQKGDSLYKIARDYNTDINVLAKLNGLNTNDYIYPNQTIMVPRKNTIIYITKSDDTIQTIASTLQTNPQGVLSQNPYLYLVPDQLVIFQNRPMGQTR